MTGSIQKLLSKKRYRGKLLQSMKHSDLFERRTPQEIKERGYAEKHNAFSRRVANSASPLLREMRQLRKQLAQSPFQGKLFLPRNNIEDVSPFCSPGCQSTNPLAEERTV